MYAKLLKTKGDQAVKYAVAVLDYFDNENTVHIVEAETPIAASELELGDKEFSIEEFMEEAFNCDIAISLPVPLDI
jgi:hypothetical protein